ncbi:hypothetical protein DH2020_033230 [Rehmannia glutinosa]|uniref:Uncharacterized protein n=1 Tax=Rehmannia glutinosa TaxID=99300 RepID=A0ABR0VF39_REHGL
MNYYFSSDLFILLSRVMNSKNSIFLICNGLLFILAKTSGCVRSSPSYPSGFDLNDVLQKEIIESEVPIVEKHVILEELSVEEEEDNEEEFECSSEKSKEVSIFINTESDEEEEEEVVENDESESKSCWLFDDDEKEEEDEDETEMLSTEELNQKFENFIRRMKEEFRINEARQQLVVVNLQIGS